MSSDRKRARDLAEARQSGQVPPEMDVKTGSMINPHNPEFITKKPWYLGGGDDGPTLDHQQDQRLDSERVELSMSTADKLLAQRRRALKSKQLQGQFEVGMWVEGLKNNKAPYQICQILKIAKKGTVFDLKYEDGTVERKVKLRTIGRPRIRMTKTGNRSFAIDAATHGKETYDSKRDKYHGFDGDGFNKRVASKFQKREELRRKLRAQKEEEEEKDKKKRKNKKKKDDTADGSGDGGNEDDSKDGSDAKNNKLSDADSDFDDSDLEGSDSEDEFVQKDEKTFQSRLARQGGVGGAQMKVTARNLRIREDTAKYLRNLDVNSAYYDPKSRSMRDNPNPEQEDPQFAGDNFVRVSGDAVKMAETQVFAWDASKRGVATLHPQANPSQAEFLKKEYKTKASDLKSKMKKAVLDKYGGEEYLDGTGGLAKEAKKNKKVSKRTAAQAAAEHKTRFGVSVSEEQYTQDGRLIQNGVVQKREALKSKYEEDVYTHGHSAVWGSYFHKGGFRWGYADDHSLIRNSYGTGANGRRVNDEANELQYGTGVAGSEVLAQARQMLKAVPSSGRKAGDGSHLNRSKLYGEADQNAVVDDDKVKEALRKMDSADGDHGSGNDDDDNKKGKKRKYNSVDVNINVTEEEMEAYRLRKSRGDEDPMAKLAKSGELLEYK